MSTYRVTPRAFSWGTLQHHDDDDDDDDHHHHHHHHQQQQQLLFQLSVDPAGPALDLQVPAEIVLGTAPLSLEGGNTTTTDYTQWAVPTFPSSVGDTTGMCNILRAVLAASHNGQRHDGYV